MKLPTFEVYGSYSSGNYGAHALLFTVGRDRLWFSYETLVAFSKDWDRPTVRQNAWGPTTGKHLNLIDGGDKGSRLASGAFEAAYAAAFPE